MLLRNGRQVDLQIHVAFCQERGSTLSVPTVQATQLGVVGVHAFESSAQPVPKQLVARVFVRGFFPPERDRHSLTHGLRSERRLLFGTSEIGSFRLAPVRLEKVEEAVAATKNSDAGLQPVG